MYVCMSIHQPSSLSLAYQITKPHRTPMAEAGPASTTTSNINAAKNFVTRAFPTCPYS